MNALLIYIHLDEPVLVMDVNSGDPNSANSLDYIPGSALRGAFIRQFMRHTGQIQLDAEDPQFHDLFLGGKVRFLNAYPQSESSQRMLPTPLSWYIDKEQNDQVYDFAIDPHDRTTATWKRLEYPYCSLTSTDEVGVRTPQMQINIHIARVDRQRVTQSGSSVFRYRALAANQAFVAVVISEEDLFKDFEWLNSEAKILIGKSHLAGYGSVTITKVVPITGWQEYHPVGDDQPDLALTLLSDTLLRDPLTGAYTTELTRALNIPQPEKSAFIDTTIVGGFNRKWNLPLPQAQALRAGSTWVFEHNQDLENLFRKHEISGIGERTAEGFGRIALNWTCVEKLFIRQDLNSVRISDITLNGDSAELAQQMLNGILRNRLDQKLVQKLVSSRIIKPPANHQLSRLRAVMLQVIRTQSMQSLRDWLRDLKPTAKKQFEGARFEGKSFHNWLDECGKPENYQSIWVLINEDPKQIGLLQLGGKTPNLEKLAIEYTARLLEGVIQKALKTEKETR